MRVLVIGGTGFIGSNLVRQLLDQGDETAVFHRTSSSLANLEGMAFESITGELNDEEALAQAMAGREAVFNLAACGSSLKKDHEQRVRINVVATARIARLARETGTRLVHVSSTAAVGAPKQGQVADETLEFNRPHDHYALTKHQGEQEVQKEAAKGLHAVIACPGNVVGRWAMKEEQKARFEAISQGGMRFYPPGGVCLTDVEDVARGLALCAEKGGAGRRYILGGHNISFKDYFEEIARATGGEPPRKKLPGFLLPLAGWGLETASGLMGRPAPLDRDTAEMISRDLFYSSERAVSELGYTITDWRETIAKAAQALT